MKKIYKLLKFENAKFKILHIVETTESKQIKYYIFGIVTTNETNHKKFIQSFEMMQQESKEKFYVKRSEFMYRDWELDFVDEKSESIIRKVIDKRKTSLENKDAGKKKNNNCPETESVEVPEIFQKKFLFTFGEVPEHLKNIFST